MDISLSFNFSPWNSNYCKSIKLTFVSQNWDLIEGHNIFLMPWDPRINGRKKITKTNHKLKQFWKIKL